MRRMVLSAMALGIVAWSVSPAPAQKVGGKVQGKGNVQFKPLPGSSTPFFANSAVQQQLKLTPAQLQKMSGVWGKLNTQFGTQFSGLDKLNGQARLDAQAKLNQQFNTQLGTGFGAVLSADQMKRFNQLNLQSQGFNVFMDPQVQTQLKLSAEQQQKLGKAGADYAAQLQAINKLGQTDSSTALRQFQTLNQQRQKTINSILNRQQQQSLQGLLGESFNFEPEFSSPRPPQ